MGVDVELIKEHKPEILDFLNICKDLENRYESLEGLTEVLNMWIDLEGAHEWLMQFGTSYANWLCWIVTTSGGDPSRIDFVEPEPNTRFCRLIIEGHPWDDAERFVLTNEECRILLSDIDWFIATKMNNIPYCESFKNKTIEFKESLETVIKEHGKMLIG